MNKAGKIAATIFLAGTCSACFFRVPQSIIVGRQAETTLDPTKDFHACVASALPNVGEVFIDEASPASSLRYIAITTSRDQISGWVMEEDNGHVGIFIGSSTAGRDLSWSDSRFSAKKAQAIAVAVSKCRLG